MIACTATNADGGDARIDPIATAITGTATTQRIGTRSATRRAAAAASASASASAGPVAGNCTSAVSEAGHGDGDGGNVSSGDGKRIPPTNAASSAIAESSSTSTAGERCRGRRRKKRQNGGEGRSPADEDADAGVGNGNYGNYNGGGDRREEAATGGRKDVRKSANAKLMPPFDLRRDVGGLASVADLLRGRRNVLVLAGAGLSVSCGIPDFRSADGLYATLDAQELGLHSAEELFELDVFKDDPRPFYRFAKSLYPGSVEPSVSHKFLGMLEERGMLLRLYTQNIDGLEEIAGVSRKRIVHAHGSLNWAQCMKCGTRVDSSVIADDVRDGVVPRCTRSVMAGKRKRQRSVGGESTASSSSCSEGAGTGSGEEESSSSSSSSSSMVTRGRTSALSDDGDASATASAATSGKESLCRGVIKPGVTFFGEKLSDAVTRSLEADRRKADALIVIGTSLSVAPMSKVIRFLPPTIPRILINRNHVSPPAATAAGPPSSSSGGADNGASASRGSEEGEEADFRRGYTFDACLLGNCDDVTSGLARELGWIDSVVDDGGGTGRNEDDVPRGAAFGSSSHGADHHHHLASDAVCERTFLFPGAMVTCDEGRAGGGDAEEVEVEVREIAHCDGCGGEIIGTIMKCTTCFDYDLCETCFPPLSGGHFGGSHKFVPEMMTLL